MDLVPYNTDKSRTEHSVGGQEQHVVIELDNKSVGVGKALVNAVNALTAQLASQRKAQGAVQGVQLPTGDSSTMPPRPKIAPPDVPKPTRTSRVGPGGALTFDQQLKAAVALRAAGKGLNKVQRTEPRGAKKEREPTSQEKSDAFVKAQMDNRRAQIAGNDSTDSDNNDGDDNDNEWGDNLAPSLRF